MCYGVKSKRKRAHAQYVLHGRVGLKMLRGSKGKKGTLKDILSHFLHWKGTLDGILSRFVYWKDILVGTLSCVVHWKKPPRGSTILSTIGASKRALALCFLNMGEASNCIFADN